MKIFYVEDNKIFSVYFDYIINLQDFERELYELYEFWSYEKSEAISFLEDLKNEL